MLAGQQLRAIEGEQRLAPPDELAGKIHRYAFDPSIDLGVDARDACLVRHHAACEQHRLAFAAPFRGAISHSDQLLFVGADLDRARRRDLQIGVDRLEIVACGGIQSGFIRSVFRIVRVAIMVDLARGFAARCHRPVRIDRLQLHAAIGRDPRLVGFVPGMHRIHVIEDLPLGFWSRARAVPTAVAKTNYKNSPTDRSQNEFRGPHFPVTSSATLFAATSSPWRGTPVSSSSRARAISYIITCS